MERAWLEHVLTLDRPVFGLARIRRATVLLDRNGLARLAAGEVSPARFLDGVRGRSGSLRARTEAAASRLSVARWPGVPKADDLSARLGYGPRYLSVGHAGLDARGLGALAELPGARAAAFIHDTIPLDLPHTQKPGASERFRQKLGWVARAADLVFAPLEATAADVRRHLPQRENTEDVIVAPPGVCIPEPGKLPPGIPAGVPFFLALGTIEPRKNHALLLDLWERLGNGPEVPRLVIAGRRGWRNEAVFCRLDAQRGGSRVIEWNDLDDRSVAALLKHARGLLFPSLAEGFGYPPLEAVGLGTPVVASPLPQTRELLGDTIIYADMDDLYQWEKAVGDLACEELVPRAPRLPGWREHFNTVLSSLG